MTHLESLTKKLHALLPELLELSFGCRITTNKWNSNYSIETITGTYHGEFVEFDCLFRNGRIKAHDIAEVLGHEPQLHHVLKAFEKKYGRRKYAFNTGGFLLCEQQVGKDRYDREYRFVFDEKGRNVKFDLTLPLHQQSPETIKFLDDLLPEPSQND